MKQKEISKLKKHLTFSDNFLSVNKMASAVVCDKTFRYYNKKLFTLLEDHEQFVFMKLLKENLGGKTGKAILEYAVSPESFTDGSGIQYLYELNKGELEDDDKIKEVMLKLVEASLYDFPVCVTMAHITYSVPNEKNEDVMEETDDDFKYDGEIFNFILMNLVPLSSAETQLYFNEKEPALKKRIDENGHLVLEAKATDVVMFPVLNGGMSDVNYVLYKTLDPKKPNQGIVEDFLEANFTMSGVDEENKIANVIYETFGEDISLDVIQGIKKEIKEIENNDKENPEVTRVSSKDIMKTLENIGCDEETIEKFETNYKNQIGEDIDVQSSNVTNTENTKIKVGGVEITVKEKAQDKVSIQKVNGVKCIVIELDECVKVDGMIVKI